ncbi:ATP-binding cassette domain-containing protein [Microcella daejeonensis]|uniref:ATP-binding cassette domain-containing protein n=1 Tax=Microcella daejeonensis TaxID=2994971 RepID=UPI0022712639|nr:ATP-binding cassette domain-containing protein [Microcella daejeonensis]WAB84475.1 ATP-binding cassette domain-containing protein [Microcella daejeonensis]
MQQSRPAFHEAIVVRGARTNNLTGVDVDIPKRRLVVITGVSGSGKSSLAFDTIAAESQRLLTETYPAFVQNQLPHAPRPDADELRHLTATIAVTQSPMAANPRSTVGTATDGITLLRQLFAAHGAPAVPSPQALSFNSPRGACPECEGSGSEASIDEDALLDDRRSLDEGGITFPNFAVGSLFWKVYARSGHFDTRAPIGSYSADERRMLLHGTGPSVDTGSHPMAYEGVVLKIRRLYLSKARESLKPVLQDALAAIATTAACSACAGTRLSASARGCLIEGRSIAAVAADPADRMEEWLAAIDLPSSLEELRQRLLSIVRGMQHVGLGYLSLDRPTGTLSGGEAQRIRTVMHLDSALTELTYVFDEPAAGLHEHDTTRVIDLLHRLRDKGNTVIVVEHHRAVIRAADHVLDMGPGAGREGGRLLFAGTPAQLQDGDGPTARGLAAAPSLSMRPRTATGMIAVRAARRHNLDGIDVDVPTGCLVAVTGVAGAGKTSLLRSIPREAGLVALDQSPIRGSRRSSIATFTGALDDIRTRFAQANRVAPGLFSPNGAGGCAECAGLGVIITNSVVGEALTTTCPVCDGRRFDEEVLQYRLDGLSIDRVLDLPARDAAAVFSTSRAGEILRRVTEVGIGYVAIGQPLTQLSGGERQRLRLATELRQQAAVYVLDEPTTGLHSSDVATLTALLHRLVDDGCSVIVADHDLHLIATADHVIDLGPGAGTAGGRVCFEGSPRELVAADTPTGRALRRALEQP